MKTKFALVFVFLILFANAMFSADEKEHKVSFGLDVTPAITWLNITNPEVKTDGSKIKLNGGLNLYFNLADSYAIATGLRLNSYGGVLRGTDNLLTEKISYKFQEVEIPIGLKLRTGSIGNVRIAANLGLGLGIMIKGSASKEVGSGLDQAYKDESFGYNLLFTRALYNLGLGVEYNLHGVILTGSLNYKGWFTPIYFYKSDITTPTQQLSLAPTGHNYKKDIKFEPSALELAIGILF